MNLVCGIILSGLFAFGSTAAVTSDVDKPTEEQIFGFLTGELDTTNLLYICDLSKNYNYLCNATALGFDYIKGHGNTTDSKEATEKAGKMKVFNINGHWSDSDGFMKSNYIKLDYLDIVAKCYFRTKYYECFGVPRCGVGFGLFTNCGGGESWRGNYRGTPAKGFKGNVTAEAQQNAVSAQTITPETTNTTKSHAAKTPVVTPSSRAANETANANATNFNSAKPHVIPQHRSKTHNKTGIVSEGVVGNAPENGASFAINSDFSISTDGDSQVQGASISVSTSSSFPFLNFESSFPEGSGHKGHRGHRGHRQRPAPSGGQIFQFRSSGSFQEFSASSGYRFPWKPQPQYVFSDDDYVLIQL